jgi:hypothetical protein
VTDPNKMLQYNISLRKKSVSFSLGHEIYGWATAWQTLKFMDWK